MKLYFVRHTEYFNPENLYAFHLPFYLSEKGRVDGRRLGKWFADHDLGGLLIYSSPIVRAIQTAELIASLTNSMVVVDKRLIESACPYLEGKVKPLKNHWIQEEDDPSREKRETLVSRMVQMYEDVVAKNTDCILVSHGDPLTYLYYHLIKKDPPRYLWDPQSEADVVHRGEIMTVHIENGVFKGIERAQV